MKSAQIIVLATPVFFLMIGLELWVARRRGSKTYRLNDAMNSIGLGMLSQLSGLFIKLFGFGAYVLVYENAAVLELSEKSLWVWGLGLLAYDFLYYWYHRFGHTVGLMWAAHAVHHQSEDYNLSTALRQTSSGWIVGWMFYLPMALIGFPPVVFGTVALIDLLYQYWVHTEQIGRLGWFDRWFCSPSNHRVHHAVNEPYLDRNYGGILVIWDRMFGSFQEELDEERCVYGTRDALRSWNPVISNIQVYVLLWQKMGRARRWQDKLLVWWKPAGWQPPGLEQTDAAPYDPFAKQRYDPQVSPLRLRLAAVGFCLILLPTTALMWWAHELSRLQMGLGLAAVTLGLIGIGQLCSGAKRREASAEVHATAPSA